MDKFSFSSPIYVLYLAITFGIVVVCHFIFLKRFNRAKLIFLYIVAGINVAQHLLKSFVWPHLYGTGFSVSNTFYNVCATMILLTPIFLWKCRGVVRESIALVGSVGAILALVIPFWFINKSIFHWEFLRFWTCHLLLLITSILPITWRMVKFKFSDFWKIGLCFGGFLCIILLNDVLCISVGIYGNGTVTIMESLNTLNPFCMMHPSSEFAWLEKFVRPFTPRFFMGSNGQGYTPIMWYMIPLYLIITLVAIPIMLLLDHYSNSNKNAKIVEK